MAYNDGYKGCKDSIKVWVVFTMNSTAIQDSYNVSSVTDQGTGHCQINYITALPDSNYACFGSADPRSGSTNYSNGTYNASASYGKFYREGGSGSGHDTSGPAHFFVIGA